MFGKYIIGVIETENNEALLSKEKLKKSVLEACRACKLNIVGEKFHVFGNPKGITYCFILSQSHFIVHTWPEAQKILLDIFTCDNEKNSEDCIKTLAHQLNGKVVYIKQINV